MQLCLRYKQTKLRSMPICHASCHQHNDAKSIEQDASSGDYTGYNSVGSPVNTHTPVSLTPVSLAGYIMVRCWCQEWRMSHVSRVLRDKRKNVTIYVSKLYL
jgi:hypothetical protein